jgi:hypothetical protein
MARIYTTEIDGEEYIGESLFKINDNFLNIDNLQQSLSSTSSFTLQQAILALRTAETTLTSFNALVALLNTSGVFRTPVSVYVSPTGSDVYSGTRAEPFATIDKALNTITGVAGVNSIVDSSRTEKKFDFFVVLKDTGTYYLSSVVSFENFPGNIHFIGEATVPVLSAYVTKPSKAGQTNQDIIFPDTESNYIFGGDRLAASLGPVAPFKVFQSFGKNVVPLPGYANHYYAATFNSAITSINTDVKQTLSAQNTQLIQDYEPESGVEEQKYFYLMLNNYLRELQDGDTAFQSERIANYKPVFGSNTTITKTFSGVPMFLTNFLNWNYTASEILQLLKYVGDTTNPDINTYTTNQLKAFGTEGSENNILGFAIDEFTPSMTQYDYSNVLFYNNTCGLVVDMLPLPTPLDTWSLTVDLTGSLLADRWKPAIVPGDNNVYGIHNTTPGGATGDFSATNYIPFWVKSFYELYRGVYDKISPDITSLQASAYNIDYDYSTFDPAPTFNRLVSTVRIPQKSAGGRSGFSKVFIQPLPVTLMFTNSAAAGFNIKNSNVSFNNVFIRGPRQPYYLNEFNIDNNIGINVSHGGQVVLNSDCAVSNFTTGIQATDNSAVLITGQSSLRPTKDPALTVTDNTNGILLRNSKLFTTGPRLITCRNYENGIHAVNSDIYLQGVDILHNGSNGLYLDSSKASIANICVIGNRYGIDCRRNSSLNVSLNLAFGDPRNRDYVYINQMLNTPNIIYCNNLLDYEPKSFAPKSSVNVENNSFVSFDKTCFIKNALSGATVDLKDSSSAEFTDCVFMGGRGLHNGHTHKGVRAEGGHVKMHGTTLNEMCTAVELNTGSSFAAQNLVISRSNVGIGCNSQADVNVTLLNYPSGNNVFNANITNIFTAGNHNRIVCEGEHVNYKSFAVHLTGVNNFATIAVDSALGGSFFVSSPSPDLTPEYFNTLPPLGAYTRKKYNLREL